MLLEKHNQFTGIYKELDIKNVKKTGINGNSHW